MTKNRRQSQKTKKTSKKYIYINNKTKKSRKVKQKTGKRKQAQT